MDDRDGGPAMTRWGRWIRQRLARLRPAAGAAGERGITFIELAIMSLIVTIALVAITQAIQVASKGSLMAKEKSRAMALARDRLEEVKAMGYTQLKLKVSAYVYPDQPDPAHPLYQQKDAVPYPATAPGPDEDPWTPETILMGGVSFWRHVKVKFVRETTPGGPLAQEPDVSVDGIGGTGIYSNLAMIEVDLTWQSRRTGRMEQFRLTSLVANTQITTLAIGVISGTILDDDCGGAGCTADGADAGTADDKPVTWAQVIVVARNAATNQSYSTITDLAGGAYQIRNLPNGSYFVELRGTPVFRDSAYTGTADPSSGGNPAVPVELTPAAPEALAVDIWTHHVQTISVRGTFKGVDGSVTPQTVRVSANDGISNPVTWTITQTCSAGTPCWYVLPDVAWPALGTLIYQVWIENITAGTINSSSFCVDSSAVPMKDFYIGTDPTIYGGNPCNGGGGICSGLGWSECVSPNPITPLDPNGASFTSASVRVKVYEYYDNKTELFSAGDLPLVRVTLRAAGSGVGVTLLIDGSGVTTFSDPVNNLVPLEAAGAITVQAWVSTTGWATDSYVLPFATDTGIAYDMEIGGAGLDPPADQRHTFVLARVAEICGTVWEVPGVKGFAGASVLIRNDVNGWSTTVKCDNQGRFSHRGVPKESSGYTISPVVGADFVATPTERSLTIGAHGVVYAQDFTGDDMEFTLNAVNAHIRGTVSKTTAGNLVRSGAVVIASTYAGAFPTTLPAAALAGQYTYSTVTLTDGTYDVKVATGVGTYRLYAYMMKDGVLSIVEQVGPVAVSPGAETTQNLVIP